MLKNKLIKITIITSILFGILITILMSFYILILPKIIKSEFMISKINKIAKNLADVEIEILNPNLKTKLSSQIDFSIDDLKIKHDNEIILKVEQFDSSFSLNKLFSKRIKINKLTLKEIFLNSDELIKLIPNQKSKKDKSQFDWFFEIDNSLIKAENFNLIYVQNNSKLNLNLEDINLISRNEQKFLDFSLFATMDKNNRNYLKIAANAKGKIKIEDSKIEVNELDFLINNSLLKLSAKINQKDLLLNVRSNNFSLLDVFNIINSDFVIPNGENLLSPLQNPKGSVAFDVNSNNFNLDGFINIKNTKINIKDLSNIPITIKQGNIKIQKDKINFENLIGYYGKKQTNSLKIEGTIKDYYKTFDSNIIVDTKITNEFLKDYLSKLINTNLYISEASLTRIIYKAKNNIMDITWLAKISKGVNFGIDESITPLSNYDRAVKGDFNINKNILTIKNINYYIANDINVNSKISPIVVIDGSLDLSGKINKIGFSFNREMPSEFLNIFTKAKTFKKGTFKGSMHIVFKENIPYLNSDIELLKTIIPSQRLFIKQAKLKTNSDYIFAKVEGRFKRASFDFKGRIKNKLQKPYVIKNIILDIDNLDIEKIVSSINSQQQYPDEIDTEEILDDDFMFDVDLVRIEEGDFSLKSGKYKDLTFGNLNAKLSLDENGLLKIKSNKFDIANGISSLKTECDFKNRQYYLKLGVKDVDSNIMAKTLLNLDKEISGPASGLIEIRTDKTLKLNGDIKFLVNNGTIGKIGLVEYILKIASLFRNPVVMANPATIIDIIAIPEGKFDKITGELKIKDNVAYKINIKSYSKTLSALIKGRFDLNKHDASLRIYTRFSQNKKSNFNFLRNISLNALANKVKLNSRNDANYYESELKELPQIEAKEENTQIFLTQVEGDVEHNNFLSSLKKIK